MDLDLRRVLQARPGAPQNTKLAQLTTPWGEALDEENVLPEHPRPQFRRESWQSLNGWWDYAIRESTDAAHMWDEAPPPTRWDGAILVPFSPEASLSHVGRRLMPSQLLWYRREIQLECHVVDRCLILHFEAVDYACAVYVNGVRLATHVGGYLPFDIDVTHAVGEGANVVELCVWDPSEYGTQLRGKQRINRGNMWYMAQSGIWQSVWLEEVAARHIESARFDCDVDAGTVSMTVQVSGAGGLLEASVYDAEGSCVGSAHAYAEEERVRLSLRVGEVHLWELDDPYLYDVCLTYGSNDDEDKVCSYLAFRTVGLERDDKGIARFCLNHQPVFVRGVLDQGYWPDGLMTAPSDDALIHDIEAVRSAGFNMLRKHIKIESRRWYWHCDRLGMLVWQDMVSGGGIPEEWTSANTPTLFRATWARRGDVTSRSWRRFGADDPVYRAEWQSCAQQTVDLLGNHPCIATWVLFNESWGQFSSREMCARMRERDSTRPYVATSGWYDQGAGDYYAVHNYFRGMRVYRDPHGGPPWHYQSRAFLINEFGGLTCPIKGHVSVPDITYGYDAFEDLKSWRNAYTELMAHVSELQCEGLAGYVYTQLSDVEEETNGLLTYDRRLNKLTSE